MTLVIVIRHIDLSVGFLAGFIGAMTAVSLVRWGWPVYLAIPFALGLGALTGLVTGFLVAHLKIPSFVASLAGWLIYRGAILLVTMGTGTIIPNRTINAIGNGFLPDIPGLESFLPGVHKLTLLLGILSIILSIVRGAVLAAAVIFDVTTRNRNK